MTRGQSLATDAAGTGQGVRQGRFLPEQSRTSGDDVRTTRRLTDVRGPEDAADRAYMDLVDRQGEAVHAYLRRLTRNRNLAEDVYQETLLKAWRHRHALVGREGSVRSWFYTVAHNAAVDQLRGRRPVPVTGEIWDSLQRPVPDHADAVVTAAALMPALRRLTVEHRDVLFELYYRRSTVAEAARSIGVPPGTVKSRAHYAVRALRAELVPTAGDAASSREVPA